jgi:hypothetical protein
MISARCPQRRQVGTRGSRALLLVPLLWLPCTGVRADETALPCEADDEACRCAQDASCWDFAFLSSGRATSLGLKTTLTWVARAEAEQVEAGVLASYRAEVYRTRDLLSSHLSVYGALGAGSAGTEGALSGAIDFGLRLPISLVSGPVLRVGPNGWLFGHDALQLRMLEPLRISAGFQRLIGDTLLEGGLTAGLLGSGRFAAAGQSTSLSGALALGHYLAAHVGSFRFDGRVVQLQSGPFQANARLGLVQLEACAYAHPLVLCVDVRHIQSRLAGANTRRMAARAVYAGAVVGLTP